MNQTHRRNLDLDGLMDVLEVENAKIEKMAQDYKEIYNLNIPEEKIRFFLFFTTAFVRRRRLKDIPDSKDKAEHIAECRKYIEECLTTLDSMMSRVPWAEAKMDFTSSVAKWKPNTRVKWHFKNLSYSFYEPYYVTSWGAVWEDEMAIFDTDDHRAFCRHAKRLRAFYARSLSHDYLRVERGTNRFRWVGYEKALAAKEAYIFLNEFWGVKASIYSGQTGKRPSAYCRMYGLLLELLGHTIEPNPIAKLKEGVEWRRSELDMLKNNPEPWDVRKARLESERREKFKQVSS